MPKIEYVARNFGAEALKLIQASSEICEEYAAQGYDMTLRQLYYQHVKRNTIVNCEKEYKRLGDIISNARLAGLIDWDHIVDRTRNLRTIASWDDPSSIVGSCAHQYKVDRWENQPVRIEVWVEKDALSGVLDGVHVGERVPCFACKGYTSQSEMWAAAQRMLDYATHGQNTLLLHLGDHDPSGIDMTRDIAERLAMFARGIAFEPDGENGSWHINRLRGGSRRIEVRRIALNMAQIREHDPPPNPAKITDSRSHSYIQKFGHESWELDALDPRTIHNLIKGHVLGSRDDAAWKESGEREEASRHLLHKVVKNWDRVVQRLN